MAPTVAAAMTSLNEVRPEQMDCFERHQRFVDRGRRSTIHSPSTTTPSLSRRATRELPPRRPAAARQLEHRRIVGIDDRPIGCAPGSRKSALFAAAYASTRRMAIQMIRREIQHHGDPRMERLDLLQLKAARFDDVQRLGCRVIDLRAQRPTDVAADRRR